jgi:RsiW-degrading membrane proteinase PrsW (M82 family)
VGTLTALGLAVVPPLLLLWMVHRQDVFPEPPGVVWRCFLLGLATVVPVLLIGGPVYLALSAFPANPYATGLMMAFVGAAIPEEAFKFGVVRYYAARHPAFNEPMDGIVYGVAASLGFATFENVLYAAAFQFSIGVVLLRAVTAIPMHGLLGGVMGWFVARWRFGPRSQRKQNLALALAVPVLLHGLYDFPLLTLKALEQAQHQPGEWESMLLVAAMGLPLAILVGMSVAIFGLVQRMRREQLRHQARGGAEGLRPGGSAHE